MLYNADSYEFIKTMPDASVNLIITDPPYELVTGGNKGCLSHAIPFASGTFKSDLEFIVAMKEKGATFQGDSRLKSKFYQGGVVKDKTTSHPTPKPVNLIKKIMMIGSNKGDVVFDPFLGSGTTAMVAKELGRECIGVEIEKNTMRKR